MRQDEMRDGLSVRRVPDLPSHDDSASRRALSLVTFAFSATSQVRWLRDCDVVLTYLSPATVGLASWSLKRVSGVPYVLYVQDLWPETVAASGFISNPTLVVRTEAAIHRALRALYREASGVVALSPSMANLLAGRGTEVEPVSIPNWVDEETFAPAPPADVPELDPDHLWFMYAGGIGDLQALDHAVIALTHLRDRPEIGLAFVGDGVARSGLEALVREHGLERRVRFLGPRSMTEMPGLIARAEAQLVSLRDLPLFRTTVPSKLQASMACGAPVICAVAGDATEIVRASEGGVMVPPESAHDLAEAFREFADLSHEQRSAYGQRGLEYYRSELSARAGSAKLERVLEMAVGGGR